MNLRDIRHRERLPAFLDEHNIRGSMVEIGCAYGGFAEHMTRNWKGCKRYVMVDPWLNQPKDVYKERTEGVDYEAWYRQCRSLADRDPRIEVVRDFSVNGAKLFPDGTFDVVYIDGNHSKEAVAEDCRVWWPKAKPGAIFAGHDFYTALTDGYWNEVDTAVKEFLFLQHNLPVTLTPCSSWWTEKP